MDLHHLVTHTYINIVVFLRSNLFVYVVFNKQNIATTKINNEKKKTCVVDEDKTKQKIFDGEHFFF